MSLHDKKKIDRVELVSLDEGKEFISCIGCQKDIRGINHCLVPVESQTNPHLRSYSPVCVDCFDDWWDLGGFFNDQENDD